MATQGEVEQAVRRDIRRLPAAERRSGLAMTALALARLLDGEFAAVCRECGSDVAVLVTASSRDSASVAGQLRATLAELRRSMPAAKAKQRDSVDELRDRRAARRAAR
jgi:hypothetical protein